jgi:hypothetical protein
VQPVRRPLASAAILAGHVLWKNGTVVVWVWLAGAVVAAHLAYLAFVPFGGLLALRWPRVVWAHLIAVAVGVLSITIGFDCPLTTWEQSLRRRAGQRPYTNGFVDHYLAGRVYPHGDAWVVQVLFGVAIAVSYVHVIRRRYGIRSPVRRATPPPRLETATPRVPTTAEDSSSCDI